MHIRREEHKHNDCFLEIKKKPLQYVQNKT